MTDALQILQRESPSGTLQSVAVPTTSWTVPFWCTLLNLKPLHWNWCKCCLRRIAESCRLHCPVGENLCSQYPAASPGVTPLLLRRDDPHGEEKDAVIVFTLGTPGQAKGVRLRHRAVWVQCQAKLAAPCGYHKGTRLSIATLPWFHVGGAVSLPCG
jgi:long-subunit acyl-CoA synthetase (AMP-forming)